MKKRSYVWFIIAQCFLARVQLYAHQSLPVIKDIEITDFRSPVSLTEILQEGFNNVNSLLKSSSSYETLYSVEQELSQLSSNFDEVQNTTRYHNILSTDRDFLQGMIDRIDQLIEQLESDHKKSFNMQEQQLVESITALSQDLKTKISLS